jgi:hypothetical protein
MKDAKRNYGHKSCQRLKHLYRKGEIVDKIHCRKSYSERIWARNNDTNGRR